MATIEIHFPVNGKTIPRDNGYALYSAISRLIPETHGAEWIAIDAIYGGHLSAASPGIVRLDPAACLRIRLPEEHSQLVSTLGGRVLDINRHSICLGSPQVFELTATPHLRARVVIIKGFTDPEPFMSAVQRQLDSIGVDGDPTVGQRRVVRIGDQTIVGFTLVVRSLSECDSLLLQRLGIGGRRRMGGGIFFPMSD
jgi:CRISPR-associated endonuclease/helicase Cas3